VLEAPLVVISARDARWLAAAVADLVARGFLASTPSLVDGQRRWPRIISSAVGLARVGVSDW
jgi:hypothetical protein